MADSMGKASEADRLCNQVLQADPGDLDALVLKAIQAVKTGRYEEAGRLLGSVLEVEPHHVEATNWMTRVLRRANRGEEAVNLCNAAIEAHPSEASLLLSVSLCHLDAWRNDEAITALSRAVELNPDLNEAWERLGAALTRELKFEEAITAFQHAISGDAPSIAAFVSLSNLLIDARHVDEALRVHELGRAATAGDPVQLAALASAYLDSGDSAEAESAIRAALLLEPQSDYLYSLLGTSLQRVGRLDEATEAYRKAIEIQPGLGIYYFNYAYIRRMTVEDMPLVEKMQALVRRPGLPLEQQSYFHFGLGKAFEDLRDYRRSMIHFDEANGIELRQQSPNSSNREMLVALVDSMIAIFTKEFFEEHRGLGNASEQPIFVVGMIRSGTTLQDQILSSHHQVASAGELTYVGEHVRGLVNTKRVVNQEKLKIFCEGYMKRLLAASKGKPRVIDKMPFNFLYAGLIHLAFPNARIVHCRRNPLDNGLSIYVTPYHGPVDFTHTLDSIAFSYRQYQRLMDHWRKVLPADRLFEVNYEEVVADREPVVRAELDFLGLPWDDACLSHEKNRNPIDTPSVVQARQPIYKSSVARWRRYEPWLGDLINAFPEYVSDDPETAGRARLL